MRTHTSISLLIVTWMLLSFKYNPLPYVQWRWTRCELRHYCITSHSSFHMFLISFFMSFCCLKQTIFARSEGWILYWFWDLQFPTDCSQLEHQSFWKRDSWALLSTSTDLEERVSCDGYAFVWADWWTWIGDLDTSFFDLLSQWTLPIQRGFLQRCVGKPACAIFSVVCSNWKQCGCHVVSDTRDCAQFWWPLQRCFQQTGLRQDASESLGNRSGGAGEATFWSRCEAMPDAALPHVDKQQQCDDRMPALLRYSCDIGQHSFVTS